MAEKKTILIIEDDSTALHLYERKAIRAGSVDVIARSYHSEVTPEDLKKANFVLSDNETDNEFSGEEWLKANVDELAKKDKVWLVTSGDLNDIGGLPECVEYRPRFGFNIKDKLDEFFSREQGKGNGGAHR